MTSGSQRTPLIVGNWKMNFTEAESVQMVKQLQARLGNGSRAEVVVSPSFPNLAAVHQALGKSSITLAAQDLHWEESGPFTGEVSAAMLRAIGCRYAIVGHSERRRYFGETDHTVNLKVRAALGHQLRPLVCVGESEEERNAGRTAAVIRTQVLGALEGVEADQAGLLVIAYEPVWAIGTGKTATGDQAAEVHRGIRQVLEDCFNGSPGKEMRILYGGSVTTENIASLMSFPVIDGVLVGGASLRPDRFARICEYGSPGALGT
ncbi:MAG: triose-phosphate isomerase [Acidobacteriota bacterium]